MMIDVIYVGSLQVLRPWEQNEPEYDVSDCMHSYDTIGLKQYESDITSWDWTININSKTSIRWL